MPGERERNTMDTNENRHPDPQQARAKLWELIKDMRFAMFTTRHASNGHLHSRPMTTQNKDIDEGASLWFFMNRNDDPVADLRADPLVNLVYADPGADSYVSVSGSAAVVENLEKKKKLWSKMNEAWFPAGPSDPDLALVEVKIIHANYWDVTDSKIVQLFKMAKAAVTGEPPAMGEQAEVRMR
jgi:general stress protein 26